MSLSSPRNDIIAAIKARLLAVANVAQVIEAGELNLQTIANTVTASNPQHVIEMIVDNSVKEGEQNFGMLHLSMQVGLLIWLGDRRSNGQTWANFADTVLEAIAGVYMGTSDPDGRGTFGDLAIRSETDHWGGLVIESDGLRATTHSFTVWYRMSRSDGGGG